MLIYPDKTVKTIRKIRLFPTVSDEFEEREEQFKNYLLSAMKKNETKLYARECTVEIVTAEKVKDFFDKNHIQGFGNGTKWSVVLKYNNEIVGAMSCGRHPNPVDDSNMAVLNRLAFKAGVTVSGGASKMFKKFKEAAKLMEVCEIITWSDNRWSDGNIYKVMGFELNRADSRKAGRGLSDGSIYYEKYVTYAGKRITKEREKILKSNGIEDWQFGKIYDCGKKRWIYSLNPKDK